MDKPKLKQPKKYAHKTLDKKIEIKKGEKDNGKAKDDDIFQKKTKHIQKLPDKKIIRKKNDPSAIRLAAINQTFHKIENNANTMIKNFKIDQNLFQKFMQYCNKVKCKCNRNVKYYCLKCMFKNPELQFPQVHLPFNIRVIHHSSQKINKSSIAPMALLSEELSLQMFNSSANSKQLLKGFSPHQTYILFPHKNSQKVSQIEDFGKIKNIAILDCTWFQTDLLVASLQKQGFNKFIRLQDYQSLYWRYNHHSDKALSSAQALIYFLRQYQKQQKLSQKQYDNLMFLYCLNLKIIQGSYRKIGQTKQQVEEEQRMSND